LTNDERCGKMLKDFFGGEDDVFCEK